MDNIYKKIEALRKELPAMKKNKPGYNYQYFDINQMIEVLRPLLEKHGLSILQPLTNIDGRPSLTTIIMDDKEDTAMMETVVTLPDLQDPQKMGSAITYMRRYALQSLLFMEAEDDDGVKAKPVQSDEVPFTKKEKGNLPF
jgi:hypothetical protein